MLISNYNVLPRSQMKLKPHFDILHFLDRYRSNGNVEYALILNDRDPSAVQMDGIVKKHVHMKMRYHKKGSKFYKDKLIQALPYASFEACYDWEASMAYLLHEGWEGKFKYEYSDLITNISQDTYQEYVSFKSDKDAAYKERERIREESRKMRYEAMLSDFERKAHALKVEARYKELRDDIYDGKVKRRGLNNSLVQCPENEEEAEDNLLLRDVVDAHRSKINSAFEERHTWMKENLKNRHVDVIFIEGGSGLGKTLYGIELATSQGKLYSLSSSKNDPLQDMLPDDDVFILNDIRDSTFKFNDLLLLLDPNVNTSVSSRYFNKTFFGDTIIITSFQPLDEWYLEACEDKSHDGHDARKQLNRRIHQLIKVKEAIIEIYTHHEDGTNTLDKTIPNPTYLLEKEFAHVLHYGDEVYEKAALSAASKLNIESAYEEFKKEQNLHQLQEKLDKERDIKSRVDSSHDIGLQFICDDAIAQLRRNGLQKVDAMKYLLNEIRKWDIK